MPHDEEVMSFVYAALRIIKPSDIVEAEMLWGPHVPRNELITASEIEAIGANTSPTPEPDPAKRLLGEVFENRSMAVKVLGDVVHWGPSAIKIMAERLREAHIENGLSDSDRELVQWAANASPLDIIRYTYQKESLIQEAEEV